LETYAQCKASDYYGAVDQWIHCLNSERQTTRYFLLSLLHLVILFYNTGFYRALTSMTHSLLPKVSSSGSQCFLFNTEDFLLPI
jgi:hypothetical protein